MAVHKIAWNRVRSESVRADQVGPDRTDVVEELSTSMLISLHLIPGALVTAAFVIFAPLVNTLAVALTASSVLSLIS
ncbi:MAG TPA: hypothetical protein VIT65_23860 [Microlunatus sp.]